MTQNLEKHAEEVCKVLKAFSNEKRLQIICILNKGERSVGQIEDLIDLSQSALSQHLARLRKDKIVTTRRNAQTIYYALNDNIAKSVLGALCTLKY